MDNTINNIDIVQGNEEKHETAEERILNAGYENVTIFSDNEYGDALIGISEDNRAIYDFDLMVEWIMKQDECSEIDAIEWIEYNVLRSLPYWDNPPIILYRLY